MRELQAVNEALEQARHLLRDGRNDEAVAALEAMTRTSPENAQLHALLGQAYAARGDHESALDCFNMALHYDPSSSVALRARADALDRLGDAERATRAYEAFVSDNPGHRDATLELAWRLYRSARGERAAAMLEEIVAADPADRDGLNLLGLVRAREFGEFERGEALLRRALAIDPSFDAALANLGWVLGETGRYDEALACFDEVLRRCPGDHETRLMRAHMNLKRGEFAAGWDDFEARHHSPDARARRFGFSRWAGQPLARRTLLVTAEQGIGDQIMFAGCLPELLGLAQPQEGRCIVEAEARLAPLFARSFPQAQIVSDAPATSGTNPLAGVGVVDYQIPIGSLPALYRRSRASFPDHHGYLKADSRRITHWRGRLAELGPRPWIGVSWRGGAPTNRRQLRSIDLDVVLPGLRCGGTLISLQYGDCVQEVARAEQSGAGSLAHWPQVLEDYDETAALVCALDQVISVCTAIVHLAGALGRPVWVLAPWAAEWRYLAQGPSMPWYPGARVFRQARPGDWEPVLGAVQRKLSESPSAG